MQQERAGAGSPCLLNRQAPARTARRTACFDAAPGAAPGPPVPATALGSGSSPLGKDLMPSNTSTAPSAQMGWPSGLNTGRRPLGQQRCTKCGRGRPICGAGGGKQGFRERCGSWQGLRWGAPGCVSAQLQEWGRDGGLTNGLGSQCARGTSHRFLGPFFRPAPQRRLSSVAAPPEAALTLTLIQLVSSPVAATHDTASRQAWCASARLMRPAREKAMMTARGEKTATQGTAQVGTWLGFSGKLYRQYCRRQAAKGAELGPTHALPGQGCV